MNLNRYIEGLRKGRDINYLERKAMQDPFLADALEGYDQVKGSHSLRIEEMVKQVAQQTQPKNKAFRIWLGVTIVLLLIASVFYFLSDEFSFSVDNDIPQGKKQEPFSCLKPEKDSLTVADSLLLFAFPDSQLKFVIPEIFPQDTSEQDSIVSTKDDPNEKKEEEQKNKPIAPKPAVGYGAYYKYLKTQLIRPADEECNAAKGKVVLSFSINSNGRPEGIRITKSLCPSADAEAIRLVKEGPGWTAGETNVTIAVRF